MTIVAAACAPEAASSLEQTAEVHSDLTAIFTRELGAVPDDVIARRNEERCGGLRGHALEVRSTWSGDPEPSKLEAAIAAAGAYLDDRGTVDTPLTDADADTRGAGKDLAFPQQDPYQAWAGATLDGAMVQTFSACLDPGAIDLAAWERRFARPET
jgi:hypothetical protein